MGIFKTHRQKKLPLSINFHNVFGVLFDFFCYLCSDFWTFLI